MAQQRSSRTRGSTRWIRSVALFRGQQRVGAAFCAGHADGWGKLLSQAMTAVRQEDAEVTEDAVRFRELQLNRLQHWVREQVRGRSG